MSTENEIATLQSRHQQSRAARVSRIIGSVVLLASVVSYLVPLATLMMSDDPLPRYLYEIFPMFIIFGPSVATALFFVPWALASKAGEEPSKLIRALKVLAVAVPVVALVPVMIRILLGTFGAY